MIVRHRLVGRAALVLLLAGAFIAIGSTSRVPILRAAGWALVTGDSVEPADAIVVPGWTQDAGALEAADLVQRGIARHVAVLVPSRDPSSQELVRRGILGADQPAWIIKLLRSLGVDEIERIPDPDGGTEAEGNALPAWCDRNGFRSIVVVTTPDHSRRVRRVMRRAMRGHTTKVMVRLTRYAKFDPDHWWETRDGTRSEIVELEKLLLDVVRHPFS